jgi:hypothetical protein
MGMRSELVDDVGRDHLFAQWSSTAFLILNANALA